MITLYLVRHGEVYNPVANHLWAVARLRTERDWTVTGRRGGQGAGGSRAFRGPVCVSLAASAGVGSYPGRSVGV